MSKTRLLEEKARYGLEQTISEKEEKLLNQGVPIQKIIGFIQFDNFIINVDKDVLIPRYETVEVVYKAIEISKKNSFTTALDLCCGSGYIGLTLLEKTDMTVDFADISDQAIKQTEENLKTNSVFGDVIKSDLFEKIDRKYDIIISNPPYIPTGETLDESVTKFEPSIALFAGEDGNDFYKRIIKDAPKYLNQGGYLVLEIDEFNYEYIKSEGFEIEKDINGKTRIAFKKY